MDKNCTFRTIHLIFDHTYHSHFCDRNFCDLIIFQFWLNEYSKNSNRVVQDPFSSTYCEAEEATTRGSVNIIR